MHMFEQNIKQLGIEIQYAEHPNANGIAEAFLISENFLNGASSALALGDNIFLPLNITVCLPPHCIY